MSSRIIFARTLLLGGIAASAFATPAAFAQDGATAQAEASVEETGDVIVVTARRREETLIDVPVAVTALGTAQLEKLGANDLSGVQGAVPNVNIVQGRGSASSANFFIRGIGQPDALSTFDPAVGVYVDGVYLSRIQGALLNLFDVQRVEVLRGPQGTLYGKNTIGGAVNVVSKKPDFDVLRGEGSFTYGRFDETTAKGYVSAPLAPGSVALSLAGLYDHRNGLVTDPRTGRKFNDRDNLSGRAILRARAGDSLEVLLSGDYTRQHNKPTLGYLTAPLIQTNFATGATVLAPAAPYGPYDYKASTSLLPGQGQKLEHWGTSLTLNLDLGPDLTLSSISAYRRLKTDFFVDIDATQFKIGDVFVGTRQRQLSQELQLKYEGERLNGVLGLYYLDEKIASHQEAYADDLFKFGALPITFARLIDDSQRTKSYAAFGQATYDFTEKLSLTAGLRYSKETKRYNRFTTTTSNAPFPGLNGLTFRFPDNLPAPFNADNDVSFDAWTPMASLAFKPTQDTLLYASASRGFKSGGFNGRVNSVADVTEFVNGVATIRPFFKPESVWTYEVGAKGSFLDGRVTLSGAAFYSDYKNFQARVGGGNQSFPVLNAGKLRIQGFEFEALVRPIRPLTLTASVGYLDAEYKRFDDARRAPAFSCNPTGTRIVCEPAFAPPLTMRFGADYRVPLGEASSLTFGGDARFVDKQFLSVDNRPGLVENGYFLGNVYAQVDFDRFYVRGMVKNVTKSLYKTDGQEFSSVGNIQTVYFGDPRTWQVTVGARF
ncbi:TonB-dependent receptor [Novosphingobium sp. Gsoil 351]|uniref:TonB-dependent receptor n=1 Tax=Novosphingobium sp. Gsoil 351 TaxID=2675225 RepID=UPI0012B4C78B|nr:TonB-dependent receptor [Novosphingobium sp. Gsoil 351]QGN55099.1 TonB-dependent receptor [Novosphingobium sp. Gsoil 351]